MEILVHINKRIKSRPNVQLPLEDLLQKFNDPDLASLTFVSVCLEKIFIKQFKSSNTQFNFY
jgi:hypothetical protein